MTVLLLLWVIIATIIAVYCYTELLNEREASLFSFKLSKAEKDDLRRQRDVLYDSVKDMAVHWGPYHGDSIGLSRAHHVCKKIRDELDGRS